MGASPITGALWQKARLGLLGLGALALFMLIFVSIDQSYEVVIASLLSSRNLRGPVLFGILLVALIPFAYMSIHACILCGIVASRFAKIRVTAGRRK
jgi:hypothetical protein